jgi:hypothetical protein
MRIVVEAEHGWRGRCWFLALALAAGCAPSVDSVGGSSAQGAGGGESGATTNSTTSTGGGAPAGTTTSAGASSPAGTTSSVGAGGGKPGSSSSQGGAAGTGGLSGTSTTTSTSTSTGAGGMAGCVPVTDPCVSVTDTDDAACAGSDRRGIVNACSQPVTCKITQADGSTSCAKDVPASGGVTCAVSDGMVEVQCVVADSCNLCFVL